MQLQQKEIQSELYCSQDNHIQRHNHYEQLYLSLTLCYYIPLLLIQINIQFLYYHQIQVHHVDLYQMYIIHLMLVLNFLFLQFLLTQECLFHLITTLLVLCIQLYLFHQTIHLFHFHNHKLHYHQLKIKHGLYLEKYILYYHLQELNVVSRHNQYYYHISDIFTHNYFTPCHKLHLKYQPQILTCNQ